MVTPVDAELGRTFAVFEEERRALQGLQSYLMKTGLGTLLFSCVVFALSIACKQLQPHAAPACVFVGVCGLLTMTLTDLDFDELCRRRPRHIDAFAALLAALHTARAVLISPTFASGLPPILYYAVRRQRVLASVPGAISVCDLGCFAYVTVTLGYSLRYALQAEQEGKVNVVLGLLTSTVCPAGSLYWGLAAMNLAAAAAVGMLYAWSTRWRSAGLLPKSPTMWQAVYFLMLTSGVGTLWRGLWRGSASAYCRSYSDAAALTVQLNGLALAVPAMVFLVFRVRLQGVLARRFYRQQGRAGKGTAGQLTGGARGAEWVGVGGAGVFVAELAQPMPPRTGECYDLHHAKSASWVRGKVVAVRDVPPDGGGGGNGRGGSEDGGAGGGGWGSIEVQVQICAARGGRARAERAERAARGGAWAGVPEHECDEDEDGDEDDGAEDAGACEDVTVQLRNSNSSTAELRGVALATLRGVSGDNISLELLAEECERGLGEAKARAQAVPCAPGEIDFFLSHSWNDDPVAKFEALQRVTHRFKRTHGGRAPVFWLDKCCADKTQVCESEALRLLPLVLSCCRSVLVLAGPTYVQRLWCIWELHVLFAGAGGALPQVHVAALGTSAAHGAGGAGGGASGSQGGGSGGGGSSGSGGSSSGGSTAAAAAALFRSLGAFELAGACCYNPNQARQMRSAIAAAPGGAAAFEAAVRALARHGQVQGGVSVVVDNSVDQYGLPQITTTTGVTDGLANPQGPKEWRIDWNRVPLS
jgi:hypothetical protein